MYGFILNTLDKDAVFPDLESRLSVATSTLVRGMLTVFAVLTIIWLFVVLMRVFVHDLPKRSAAKKAAKAKAVAVEAVAAAPAAAPMPQEDAELIAVITAAIAAYQADESGVSFRVVSFRRVNQ